jgi:hypothetical protein
MQTPDNSPKVARALEHGLDHYEELYGNEDREREMRKHSADCDCVDCEAQREWLLNLDL